MTKIEEIRKEFLYSVSCIEREFFGIPVCECFDRLPNEVFEPKDVYEHFTMRINANEFKGSSVKGFLGYINNKFDYYISCKETAKIVDITASSGYITIVYSEKVPESKPRMVTRILAQCKRIAEQINKERANAKSPREIENEKYNDLIEIVRKHNDSKKEELIKFLEEKIKD